MKKSWSLFMLSTMAVLLSTACGGTSTQVQGTQSAVADAEQPSAYNADPVCKRTGSGSKLLIRGNVLTASGIIENGSVLVDATGRIECVDKVCPNTDAVTIDCGFASISAGFVNAHEHLTYSNNKPNPAGWGEERFDHRNDWRKGKRGHTKVPGPSTSNNEVVEVRMLMSGVTSLFGSGEEMGLVRNIDHGKNDEHLGLEENDKPIYQTFPLGDSDGLQLERGCAYSYHNDTRNFVEEPTCPFGPHIAEGIDNAARNELFCLGGGGKYDIFQHNAAFIHGVAATPEYIYKMADRGTKLIWSPRSNISLYGDTAQVTVYDRYGVTIGLGTDWIYSGSMNMLRELQCADEFNRNHLDNYFSDEKLWKMATINSAAALNMDSAIGDLKPGLWGDIAVFRPSPRGIYRAVIEARAQDVLLVARGGKILYGESGLITDDRCDSLDVCGSARKICTQTEGLSDYETLKSKAKYPFFFCGKPENEPSCVPARTREVDTRAKNTFAYNASEKQADDFDGDGILDNEDNCPRVFNPVRPGMGGKQNDADNDGIGDACDACPLNAGEPCKVFDTSDFDQDGFPDYKDNCPGRANSDQANSDNDAFGDACDECPNEYGLGKTGCPVPKMSLTDLRFNFIQKKLDNGKDVVVSGIVTGYAVKTDGVSRTGFFIQDPDILAGVYVYDSATANDVEIGDEVELLATTEIYRGLLELKSTTILHKKPGQKLPKPIVLTAEQTTADTTDSVSNNIYNSVLVTVKGVTAERESSGVWYAKDPEMKQVYIDDFSMGKQSVEAFLLIGKPYDVTGILVYDYGFSKIAPRTAEDIVPLK